MLNLILFGPPGSGKGTQATKLVEQYNLIHISTGDLLRGEISNETALGLEAKSSMDKGHLVPDEVVIGMISSKLDNNPNASGFIFDGFPRTIAQAEALDDLLELKNAPIKALVEVQVSEEELKIRLLERGKTSGRPDDQNEAVIANRIQVYRNETAPVANFYNQQNKHIEVYGEGSIDDIFHALCAVIDPLD